MSRCRKALSLVVALVMLAGLVVVPSFGASFDSTINGIYTADKTTAGAGAGGAACDDLYSKPSITFEVGKAADDLELWLLDRGYRASIGATGAPTDRRYVYYGPQGSVASLGTTVSGITVTSTGTLTNDKIEVTQAFLNGLSVGTYLFQMKNGATSPADVGTPFTIIVTPAAPQPTPAPSAAPAQAGFGFEADTTTYTIDSGAGMYQVTEGTAPGDVDKETASLPGEGALKIDLSAETISLGGFKVVAYSLDGGKKWTAKPLADGDISKLLNKGMELWLTDAYDKKAKAPQLGVKAAGAIAATDTQEAVAAVAGVKAACLIKFPKIEARPATEKLTVNYLLGADPSGKTNGTWKLSAKGSDAAFDVAKLQGVQPDGKKFDATKDTWQKFLSTGVPVKDMENGKVVKTTYFYRLAPVANGTTYVAASKTMKATAASVTKAPALKPDYKKEVLKTKKDMMLYFGPRDVDEAGKNDGTKGGIAILAEAHTSPTTDKITGKAAQATKFFGPVDPGDKDPIELGSYLAQKETYITVWTNATAKKPASMQQEITLAPRAYMDNSIIAGEKGKIKLDKTLEIFDTTKQKYGKLPKPEGAVNALLIRLKNTAKAAGADKTAATLAYEGVAAGKPGQIDVSFGVYETKYEKDGTTVKSTKNGYLEAAIIAPPYDDRIALVRPRLKQTTGDAAPLAVDSTAGNYSVVYQVVSSSPDVNTANMEKILFRDSNTKVLVTPGKVAATDIVFTPATPAALATLEVKLDSIDGAGTVKFDQDKAANETETNGVLGKDGALADYAKTFYCAPLSFEVAKVELTLDVVKDAVEADANGVLIATVKKGAAAIETLKDGAISGTYPGATFAFVKEDGQIKVTLKNGETIAAGTAKLSFTLHTDDKPNYAFAGGADKIDFEVPLAEVGDR